MGAAVLAYLARPWSCGFALSQFDPADPVPYSHFDYHGMGVISAWVVAAVFAAPVLWLAAKVFLGGRAKLGMFARAQDTRVTALSVAVAIGLGAPMHSQLAYLIGLPLSLATPVLISSLAWLLVVEVGRSAAVKGNLLSKGGVRLAVGIALLATVPKLALLGLPLLRP